jgi:hypothetical protein
VTSPRRPEPAAASPATQAPARPLFRWGQPARLALGTASALGLARFAYGLILPAMRSRLGWNLGQAGTLTTANALGYLAGAVIAASVARRLSVTATFRLGMVLTAAALAATAAAGSYPLLLVTRAVAGMSGALVFITGGVIAAHAAASARSAAPLTIYYSGAGLGIAFSGAFIPPLLDHRPGWWPDLRPLPGRDPRRPLRHGRDAGLGRSNVRRRCHAEYHLACQRPLSPPGSPGQRGTQQP